MLLFSKRTEIEHRAIRTAKYVVKHHATVRDAAIKFGYSKSSVWLDIRVRLKSIDYKLYKKVEKVVKENQERARLQFYERVHK